MVADYRKDRPRLMMRSPHQTVSEGLAGGPAPISHVFRHLEKAGPGFTNAVTSMANAYLDRTPVLYLSGSAALRDAESNTLQAGIDQVAIARR